MSPKKIIVASLAAALAAGVHAASSNDFVSTSEFNKYKTDVATSIDGHNNQIQKLYVSVEKANSGVEDLKNQVNQFASKTEVKTTTEALSKLEKDFKKTSDLLEKVRSDTVKLAIDQAVKYPSKEDLKALSKKTTSSIEAVQKSVDTVSKSASAASEAAAANKKEIDKLDKKFVSQSTYDTQVKSLYEKTSTNKADINELRGKIKDFATKTELQTAQSSATEAAKLAKENADGVKNNDANLKELAEKIELNKTHIEDVKKLTNDLATKAELNKVNEAITQSAATTKKNESTIEKVRQDVVTLAQKTGSYATREDIKNLASKNDLDAAKEAASKATEAATNAGTVAGEAKTKSEAAHTAAQNAAKAAQANTEKLMEQAGQNNVFKSDIAELKDKAKNAVTSETVKTEVEKHTATLASKDDLKKTDEKASKAHTKVEALSKDVETNKTNLATLNERMQQIQAGGVAPEKIQEIESKIASNSNRINQLDKKFSRGLATQSAIAGLFQPYNVGTHNITVAIGGFQSSKALAVGTGYRFNHNVAAKAGVAVSEGGYVSYNAGMNFEW